MKSTRRPDRVHRGREGGDVLAGYHGRYVRVDVATGTSSSESLAPEVLRRFLGGVGLGTWNLAVETVPGTDPLAEQSTLVFALSPLVGTPLTTSAKFALVAISPLTGRICDALSSFTLCKFLR
ncbi:MAG: aldehyde ferredoxin oxidoreductase N-terminal domain-containing protein [Isosphaeraceae bacterium]